MTPQLHRRLIGISLSLYFLAIFSTMAGMEIFGWLTFALTLAYAIRAPKEDPFHAKDFAPFTPWKSSLLLLLITVLGLAINGTPQADYVHDIGSQRWMFLLASAAFALALWPPTQKGYRVFLIITSITAVYAFFQSATGVDLIRPGSHRAVQPLIGMRPPWRSSGWYDSPLLYAYIVGQQVCIPIAVCLLTYKNRVRMGWIFWGSLVATLLISASIITSFTRGAWIGLACAIFAMSVIVAPRIAAAFVAACVVIAGALAAVSPTFQERLASLADPAYASNSERVFLWKANFEMFKDYPVLGIGYQENENRAKEYVTRMGRPDAFTGHAHNNYIQFLSGTGITGFVAYMFVISFMLWVTWRLWKTLPEDAWWPRALTLGALGAQIHLHVGGFTECNFKSAATAHTTMVIWGLVISLCVLNRKSRLPAFDT